MAVSSSVTDDDLTHLEQVAQDDPEAVEAMADKANETLADVLYSILDEQRQTV